MGKKYFSGMTSEIGEKGGDEREREKGVEDRKHRYKYSDKINKPKQRKK